VSENLLSIYLDEYDETPWDALKFLIAAINYGGHVTDDWDRRLLNTYIQDYFTEEAVAQPFFKSVDCCMPTTCDLLPTDSALFCNSKLLFGWIFFLRNGFSIRRSVEVRCCTAQ
jgi:hypothetical protein